MYKGFTKRISHSKDNSTDENTRIRTNVRDTKTHAATLDANRVALTYKNLQLI